MSRLKKTATRALNNFDAEGELFWEATFSVKLKDLARLKEELRQVLSGFAENAEEPDGEILRSMTVGFIDPR